MKPIVFYPHRYRPKLKRVLCTDISPYRKGPSSRDTALLLFQNDQNAIASLQNASRLRAMGWLILAGDLDDALDLHCKRRIYNLATRHGLTRHFPTRYASLETAQYPCIVKSEKSTFGRGVRIVTSKQGVGSHTSPFVVEELVRGCFEVSSLLAVNKGVIHAVLRTVYHYADDAYVYPRVSEHVSDRRTEETLPDNEHGVLSSLVQNYTGPCNFNYKVRPNGSLAIFECNIRVGSDIKDAPADMAERFLLKMRDMALAEATTKGMNNT